MTIKDSTGKAVLDMDSWAHAYSYSGSQLSYETVTDPNNQVWKKSYTYDGSGNVLTESAWVKQ